MLTPTEDPISRGIWLCLGWSLFDLEWPLILFHETGKTSIPSCSPRVSLTQPVSGARNTQRWFKLTPTLLTALRQGDTPVLGWSPVLPQGWPGWHILA